MLCELAERKQATPAQIALSWLLDQKPWIVAILGTAKFSRLEENIGSRAIELTYDDRREIESSASQNTVQGASTPKSWSEGQVAERRNERLFGVRFTTTYGGYTVR